MVKITLLNPYLYNFYFCVLNLSIKNEESGSRKIKSNKSRINRTMYFHFGNLKFDDDNSIILRI